MQDLVGERLHDLSLAVQNAGLQLVQLNHAPRSDFRRPQGHFLWRRNLLGDTMAWPIVARCAPAIVAHWNESSDQSVG
jgi:hypothetical protein